MAKFPKITRSEFKALLDKGTKVTAAGLYEPDHAPKGTKFAIVDLGGGLTRFVRIWG